MTESVSQYVVGFICPKEYWVEIANWGNVNLDANAFDPDQPMYLSPASEPDSTHCWSNMPCTVPAATLLIEYLRGFHGRPGYTLPEGWESMDKSQRLAAIADDEDAALAATGIFSILADNLLEFTPFVMLPRVSTTGLAHTHAGQELAQFWPEAPPT